MLVRPVVLKERDAYGRTIDTVGLSPISTIAMRGFLDQAARFEKYDSRAKSVDALQAAGRHRRADPGARRALAVPASSRRAGRAVAAPGRLAARPARLRRRHRHVS